MSLWLFVDPIELSVLVLKDLTLAEPKVYFLLSVVYAVGTVANIAPNILSDG